MLYRSILEVKTEGAEETEALISDTLEIEVNEVVFFQEKEGYHIAYASDEKEQEVLIFVPLREEVKKEDFIVVQTDDILSQEEIEHNLLTDCIDCELINSSPAMIDQVPLWELTYKDEANRYTIEYITLKDGEIYEQLRLYRKYSERG